MNDVAHILSPASAGWCGWAMLGLLLCSVLAEVAQPGIITQVPTVLFAKTERIYKASSENMLGQIFISVFRICVLALVLQLCWYNGGSFTFVSFAMLSGLVLATILLKMLCNAMLDYTFQLTRHYASPYEQYNAIATATAILLYTGLMLILRAGSVLAARWLFGIGLTVFFLLIVFRWWRTYVHSPIALVYTLLYILTLEVLPAAILIIISGRLGSLH